MAARAQEGLEELLHIQGQEGWREEIPLVQGKERWLRGHRRTERNYSTFKVRRDGGEEIPLVQGKEQWLRLAEAAVKR